jgi:hypothetical protein
MSRQRRNATVLRRRVALAWLVIVVMVGGVWGNGVADGSGPTKPAQVSPELKTHFALFRRTPRSGFAALLSAAPREVRRTLMNYESGARPFFCRDCRLDVKETRVVQIGSHKAWAVPGAGGACIVTQTDRPTTGTLAGQRGTYTSCSATSRILRRGLVSFGGEPDAELAYGLVPDGTTVVLRSPTGTPRSVPVVTNVFVLAAKVVLTGKPYSMTVTLHKRDGTTVSFRTQV